MRAYHDDLMQPFPNTNILELDNLRESASRFLRLPPTRSSLQSPQPPSLHLLAPRAPRSAVHLPQPGQRKEIDDTIACDVLMLHDMSWCLFSHRNLRMATLVEGPNWATRLCKLGSPVAHPSSGAAQGHALTWKLLRATLG